MADRLPRAEPPHIPQAAIRRATVERRAKRDTAARHAEWAQTKEGKEFVAEVGRKYEECEIVYIKETEGVTSPEAIAIKMNRRKITTEHGGKWTSRDVLKVLARLES